MPDPQAALATQVRNIEARTGKTLAELHAALANSGLAKHAEKRSWLMQSLGLGYGDANTVVTLAGQAAAPAAADPLAAIYTGAKAPLRALHEHIVGLCLGFGAFEQAPKKGYVSLRRSRQFAMVGPATQRLVEIGLNAKDLPADPRLKPQPPGSMCAATLRVGRVEEVDAAVVRWLKQAFDAAA